jgi:hypothetical protein
MSFVRIGEEVTMALVGQHNEFGIRDSFGQDFRGHSVIDLAGHVPIALADQDERRLLDVF